MASMGFVQHAAKTYEQNRKMLRIKSFFKEVAKPKPILHPSKIDTSQLKRKAIIIAQRKLNRKLLLVTVGSLMIFVSVLLYTLLL